MIARIAGLAAFFGVLWAPAAYAEDAPYRYCRVDDGGVSVVRTVRGGAYVYQATWGSGIVPGKRRRFDGYIGWHRAPSAPPELQLTQANGWDDDELSIPAGSRAVLDGGPGVAGFAVDADAKQDLIVYRFGLTKVLERFAARKRLRLRVYARGSAIPRATLAVDLDAARRALAVATAADAKLSNASCTALSTELPEPIDPGQFTNCTASVGTATANFTMFSADYSARIALAPGIGLAVAGSSYANQRPDFSLAWFREVLRAPYYGAMPATLQVTIVGDALDPKGKTFTLVGPSGRIVVSRYAAVPDWRALLALDAAGPLKLEIADDGGTLVRSIDVPPGALASFAPSLAHLADRIAMWEADPMRYCQPEEPIIIT